MDGKCRMCNVKIEGYNESPLLEICKDCCPDVHLCGDGNNQFDDGEYDVDAFKPSWANGN